MYDLKKMIMLVSMVKLISFIKTHLLIIVSEAVKLNEIQKIIL